MPQYNVSMLLSFGLDTRTCPIRVNLDGIMCSLSMLLQVSESLLSLYLNEYEEIPWDALKYLIAGVNYGGHVTDDWDRRVLTTYINDCFCDEAVSQPLYK